MNSAVTHKWMKSRWQLIDACAATIRENSLPENWSHEAGEFWRLMSKHYIAHGWRGPQPTREQFKAKDERLKKRFVADVLDRLMSWPH